MRQQDAGLFIERPGMSSWWDVTGQPRQVFSHSYESLVTATTALRKSGRRNAIPADGAGRAAVKNINQHHL
jgi:hypothetical protein